MVLSEKLTSAMNAQINAEMWSANLYLSMAAFCAQQGFDGFSSWLKCQSKEETEHAYMIMDYMIKRDGVVEIKAIDAVPVKWNSIMDVFEQVYKHELHVSNLIDQLVDVASSEKDKATQDFLWGFVREQVEEEATAKSIVDKLKIAGNQNIAFVDSQLGQRTK